MVDYDDIRAGRRRDLWRRRQEKKKEALARTPRERMEELVRQADQEDGQAAAPRASGASRAAGDSGPPPDLGLPGPPPEPELLEEAAPQSGDSAGGAGEGAPPRRARSYFEAREMRMQRERERDLAEYRRTIRWAGALVALLAAAALFWGGSFLFYRYLRDRADSRELKRAMERVEAGEAVFDLSTPPLALATYRSLWIRGDMKGLLDITASRAIQPTLGGANEQEYLRDQYYLYLNGKLKRWLDAIKNIKNPEYIRRPARPWRQGDLAVFRINTFYPSPVEKEPAIQMLAFAYEDNQWKFAKALHESLWKPYWTNIEQVFPQEIPSGKTRP